MFNTFLPSPILSKSIKIAMPYGLMIALTLLFHRAYYPYIWPWIKSTVLVDIYYWVCKGLLYSSGSILFHSCGIPLYIDGYEIAFLYKHAYLSIGAGCSGCKQCLQLLLIMQLVKGNWKRRLITSFSAVLWIELYNLYRITILALIFYFFPAYWQWIHDWIARPGYYLMMFFIWEFFRKNEK